MSTLPRPESEYSAGVTTVQPLIVVEFPAGTEMNELVCFATVSKLPFWTRLTGAADAITGATDTPTAAAPPTTARIATTPTLSLQPGFHFMSAKIPGRREKGPGAPVTPIFPVHSPEICNRGYARPQSVTRERS